MATNPTEILLVDTNVPIYAAGGDHPYQLPCKSILVRIVAGQILAATSAEVHQEIFRRYLSIGQSQRAREVSEDFEAVVPHVLPVTLADIARMRELVVLYPSIRARDLLHVATMLNNGIRTIMSADRHFDRIAEVIRIDPLTF